MNELNSGLKIINNWTFQWKMHFNTQSFNQASGVRFSKKSNVTGPPDLAFNKNIVHTASPQKHLALILDDKRNFVEHINQKLCKAKKGIGMLRKFYHFKPRSALLTTYKTFTYTHLHYSIFFLWPDWVSLLQCCIRNYQDNKGYIKSKALSWTRTWKAMLQKMDVTPLSLLQFFF